MVKELIKMATKLDALGLTKEADIIDALIQKVSSRHFRPGHINPLHRNPEDEPMGYIERMKSPKRGFVGEEDFEGEYNPSMDYDSTPERYGSEYFDPQDEPSMKDESEDEDPEMLP